MFLVAILIDREHMSVTIAHAYKVNLTLCFMGTSWYINTIYFNNNNIQLFIARHNWYNSKCNYTNKKQYKIWKLLKRNEYKEMGIL